MTDERGKGERQSGKDLAVFGGANLLSTLMQMDLVDEHRIMVNPVILGSGNPLFKRTQAKVGLHRVRARAFRSIQGADQLPNFAQILPYNGPRGWVVYQKCRR